jgi:fucose 4-O-acetylase-like acetyltransferase/poly-gamma-glutamate capsule biosynthesis protein CapA/YwtB (metallophosphatase superfamily)/lysophospholipase L1-like esterase
MMDNLKGVLIFLVVFSHFLLLYVTEGTASRATCALTYYLYFFHMPLFVFVSGFFSKNIEKARATAFNTLLLPYLLFNTSMMLALYAAGRIEFTILTPVYVNWYLLALFLWRVSLADLIRIRFVLPLSFLAAFAVGFVPEITNVLALGRIIAFLPFFLLGYFTSEKTIEYIRTVPKSIAVLTLLLAAWPVYFLTKHELLSLPIFIASPYSSVEAIYLRIVLLFLACFLGVAVLIVCPQKEIKGLATVGKNSIVIFLLHRYVTLAFYELVPPDAWRSVHVLTVLALSVSTVWLLGSESAARIYHALIRCVSSVLQARPESAGLSSRTVQILIVALSCAIVLLLPCVYWRNKMLNEREFSQHDLHPVLDSNLELQLRSSITISFVGDLILLEDQVKEGWDARAMTYDFKPAFQYVSPYLKRSDYSIGVLEVPLAGEAVGYSTSNYDDGIPLWLNAPDQWADAIAGAGIDLVTTATNHALDKGEEGLQRTVGVLELIRLRQVGAYRATDEHKRVVLHEIRGVNLAFLAYSYGLNYRTKQNVNSTIRHMITLLASPEDQAEFARSCETLRQDVQLAKESGADLIIALPHMGTQFEHVPDKFSRTWSERMLAEGVDVVLADHSHAVQPMEFHKLDRHGRKQGDGLIAFSPGNCVNSYVERNGDACAIVNLHLSADTRNKGRLLGASITPMWIQRPITGQWRPTPIFDAVTDPDIRADLSMLEWARIEDVHRLVTEVMLGTPLTIDQVQDRYYYLPEEGYARSRLRCQMSREPLAAGLDRQRQQLFSLLSKSKRTVVIGDSISAGSKNGGYGWFEPLISIFPGNHFVNCSVGGLTTGEALARMNEALDQKADLYIIALGTNDVRYRTKNTCAMTPAEFVRNMQKISSAIIAFSPESKIIFINAWLAYDNDIVSQVSVCERDRLLKDYNDALAAFCVQHRHVFIDANRHIRAFLDRNRTRNYILDYIHPNARAGVILYSNAVLLGAEANWRIEPSPSRLNGRE